MADDISPKGRAVVLHAYDGADLKYIDWDAIAGLSTEATLELVRLLLVSIAAEDFATQTTLAGMQSQIGAIGGGDAGTLLAYLLAVQTRLGAVGGGSAGTALEYLKDALTSLQKIDDLQDALSSVATKRLQVESKGGDKIISLESVVKETETAVISGASGYIDSDDVPAGRVWKITNIAVVDSTSAITGIAAYAYDAPNHYIFWQHIEAIGAGVFKTYSCEVWLGAGDTIRVYFAGALAGDSCDVILNGIQMNEP